MVTKRTEGKPHNAALICLVGRRCDVILAMLRTRQPYQPAAPPPSSPMPPDPQPPAPWFRPGREQAAVLEREALTEIGPGHELAGHSLTAITACSGCDRVAFSVDDGTFAIIHLTWARRQEQHPSPKTRRLGGYIALEIAIDNHTH